MPSSGSCSLVGGNDSATSIRNTVNDSSVVMPVPTFSMLSGGSKKPKKATRVMSKHGKIILKT